MGCPLLFILLVDGVPLGVGAFRLLFLKLAPRLDFDVVEALRAEGVDEG